jgi:CDGSH-type Zn-finger protein
MPRLIRHDQTGPYRINPEDFPKDGKPIWICGCGLSSKMPYCDKAHKACAAEQPGVLYTYDSATKQITGSQPDPNPPALPALTPPAPAPPPPPGAAPPAPSHP